MSCDAHSRQVLVTITCLQLAEQRAASGADSPGIVICSASRLDCAHVPLQPGPLLYIGRAVQQALGGPFIGRLLHGAHALGIAHSHIHAGIALHQLQSPCLVKVRSKCRDSCRLCNSFTADRCGTLRGVRQSTLCAACGTASHDRTYSACSESPFDPMWTM